MTHTEEILKEKFGGWDSHPCNDSSRDGDHQGKVKPGDVIEENLDEDCRNKCDGCVLTADPFEPRG
jgi:hypothetical protein